MSEGIVLAPHQLCSNEKAIELHPYTTTIPRAATSDFGIAMQKSATATRSHARIPWPEWCTLFAYAALVAFAIPYHEPIPDEAQAWQLARTLPLTSLFKTFIRYEASPGLWHFLLWVLVRAHVSYAGLHWICGAIAVASTALLVFKSPLPRYLKLTLPFTYFLVYQYAVVARSYVLVPALLFMVAIWWKKRPLVVALLLGLMANATLHAAVISGGLAAVYVIEQVRSERIEDPANRRTFLLSSLILLSFYLFAIWTAWPPHDLMNHIAETRRLQSPSTPSFFAKFVVSLCMGICPKPWVLSIPFWFALAFCLRARHSLFYLLPVLFFAVFCGAVSCGWWHAGLLIPLVTCLLWVTWPASGIKVGKPEVICRIALVAIIGQQIVWSASALEFDHFNATSPDLAASEFLRPLVQKGATIAVTYFNDPYLHAYHSVGILPYFDHIIFLNQPDSFWSWSSNNPTEQLFKEALPSHPAVVVVEVRLPRPDSPISLMDPTAQILTQAGYSFTHMFCGTSSIGYIQEEKNCHLIFQRSVPFSYPKRAAPQTAAAAGR